MTTDNWSAMLAAAKKAGACVEHYDEAAKCRSFAEASRHPDAPEWAYWYARRIIDGRWPEGEAVIAGSPERAYWYARDVIEGRWPEAEPVIAGSLEWTFRYAFDVIKGRWPEGEAVIAGSPECAYWYARRIIDGRWPEGEAVIADDPQRAYWYALDVIKGRWPEAEAVIADDPQWAQRYALDVIKGRWPEAEAVIAGSPECAYWYAWHVIKGRWPEGETVIAGSPEWACWYAWRVIKARWPEGEAVIAGSPEWAYWYARFVIKGRWPEAEAVIADDPQWAQWYALDVIKGRWPEAEAVIADDPQWAQRYALDVIKGRWPEANFPQGGGSAMINQLELLNTAKFALKYAQKGNFHTEYAKTGEIISRVFVPSARGNEAYINVTHENGMAGLSGGGGNHAVLCETAAPFAPYKVNITSWPRWLSKFPKAAQFAVFADEAGLGFKSGGSTLILAAQGEAVKFPETAQVNGEAFTIPGAALKRALKIVARAQSTEEARDYLNGVNFQARDGRLWLCATDGHQLALTSLPLPENTPENLNATLATAAVKAILKLPVKQAVTLIFDAKADRVLVNGDVFTLTGGTYPDYLRVIPEGVPAAALTVDRAGLSKAVKLAASRGKNKIRAVSLAVSDDTATLVISNTDDYGEGSQTISLLAAAIREMPFSKYNSKFLLDMLAVLTASAVVLEVYKYGEDSLLCAREGEDVHVVVGLLR